MYFYNFISTFSILIPLVFGTFAKSVFKSNLNSTILLLANVYLDAYIFAEILDRTFHNNFPAYFILNIIELGILIHFFALNFKSKKIYFLYPIFSIEVLIEYTYRNNFWDFYYTFYNLKTIAIITLIFLFLLNIIKNGTHLKNRSMIVLFIVSLLFYCLANFNIFLFFTELIFSRNKTVANFIIYFILTIEIIRNFTWLYILRNDGN